MKFRINSKVFDFSLFNIFSKLRISKNYYFSAEKDTAGVGTGMEKVEEGNTDHPPGLSLNGDQKTKKDTSRGFKTICVIDVVNGYPIACFTRSYFID